MLLESPHPVSTCMYNKLTLQKETSNVFPMSRNHRIITQKKIVESDWLRMEKVLTVGLYWVDLITKELNNRPENTGRFFSNH